MNKIASADDIYGMLTKAASVLRATATENRELKARLAAFERRDELHKIASRAVDRGTLEDTDVDGWVERWASEETPLQVLEDFVDRTPAGVPLARLEEGHEKTAGADDGVDVLTRFLTSTDPGHYASR